MRWLTRLLTMLAASGPTAARGGRDADGDGDADGRRSPRPAARALVRDAVVLLSRLVALGALSASLGATGCAGPPAPAPADPTTRAEVGDPASAAAAPPSAAAAWPCPDRGDVDGDGLEDRVVLSAEPPGARVLLGGEGERVLDLPAPPDAVTRLCLARFEGGRASLVAGIVRATTREPTFRQRVFIYDAGARGGLRPRFLGTVGAGALLDLGVADLDGDGRHELLTRERADGLEATRVYAVVGSSMRERPELSPAAPSPGASRRTVARPDFSGELDRAPGLQPLDLGRGRTPGRAQAVTIERGLANVTNRGAFRFLDRAAARAIEQDGFVVLRPHRPPGEYHELYIENQYHGLPSFVTSDTALHLVHLLVDDQLEDAEYELLGPVLARLVGNLRAQLDRWGPALPPTCAEASGRVRLRLETAAALLEGESSVLPGLSPEEREAVSRELAVIEGRGGASVLGLDAELFALRGHYTRSEALGRYFRATLLLSTATGQSPVEAALWTALALATPESRRQLARLDGFARAFVGPPATLTPLDVLDRARATFGEAPDLSSVLEAAGSSASRWFAATPDDGRPLTLLARRRPADSVFFERDPARATLPDPLELLAALGSERAVSRLREEAALAPRAEAAIAVRGLFEAGDAESVGGRWLQALRWVLQPFPEGYPAFQRTDRWADHGLVTAAASWAELRRDTILYVEPPVTWMEGGDEEELPPGRAAWVEPNPELYESLDQVLAGLQRLRERAGWAGRGLPLARGIDPATRLRRGRELLALFADASRRELAGEPLTRAQHEALRDTGHVLETLLADEGTLRLDPVPVVADVAHLRDPASGALVSRLMVATGPLDVIVVAVPLGRRVILARGPVASFHAFAWRETLTDERWRELLEAGEAPERPVWARSSTGRAGPRRPAPRAPSRRPRRGPPSGSLD